MSKLGAIYTSQSLFGSIKQILLVISTGLLEPKIHQTTVQDWVDLRLAYICMKASITIFPIFESYGYGGIAVAISEINWPNLTVLNQAT